jgi:hypothetical protein
MFGKEFRVVKEFEPIFKNIGGYEEFYAYEKDGKLEYGILDPVFGQPSPANWDESSYAKLMRSIASGYLQQMLDEDKIEEVKYE